MKWRCQRIVFFLLLFFFSSPSFSLENFKLTPDALGHNGPVIAVASLQSGNRFVTGGLDGIVRVWNAKTLREERKFIPALGPGGAIRALEFVSNDKYLIVVAEFLNSVDQSNVFVFDFANGKLHTKLPGTNGAKQIHVSPSGDRFVINCGDRVSIWQSSNFDLKSAISLKSNPAKFVFLRADKSFFLVGKDWYGIFDEMGNSVKVNHQRSEILAAASQKQFLAIGDNSGQLQLFNNDLALEAEVKHKKFGMEQDVFSLGFSHDSKRLVVGLTGVKGFGSNAYYAQSLVYNVPSLRKINDFQENDTRVDIAKFINNEVILSAGGSANQVYLWEASRGARRGELKSIALTPYSIGVFGGEISIGLNPNSDRYSVDKILTLGSISLRDALDIEKQRFISSRAFAHDDSSLSVNVSDGEIRFDRASKSLIYRKNSGEKILLYSGLVRSMASAGNRIVVACADQVIRMWFVDRIRFGRNNAAELNVLVFDYGEVPDTAEGIDIPQNGYGGVVWSKEGFFQSTVGADQFMSVLVDKGPNREVANFNLHGFENILRRPDLVVKSMNGADVSEVLVQHNTVNNDLNRIDTAPTVEILSRGKTTPANSILLRYKLCPQRGGLGRVMVVVNDRPVTALESKESLSKSDSPISGSISPSDGKRDFLAEGTSVLVEAEAQGECTTFESSAALRAGKNKISIKAYEQNNFAYSQSDSIIVSNTSINDEKGDLYIFAVAIDKYLDSASDLKNSVNDANAIIDKFSLTKGRLYNDIHVVKLFDAQATKLGIQNGLNELGKKIRPVDTVLIYAASHGEVDPNKNIFYLIPQDYKRKKEGVSGLEKDGVSQNFIEAAIGKIKAHTVLTIFDSCKSGQFLSAVANPENEFVATSKFFQTTGRATIVASASTQVAREGYKGHGVFTYAFIEALSNKVNSQDSNVTIGDVAAYVEKAVPKITKANFGTAQNPQKKIDGQEFEVIFR